ncbi:MAG: hypothetical protein M1434_02330 [Chloroflexi bacterium]|nr:hypothetical protein [Chloroflexota bacterium]MCL5273567.1 hypothetical protein [Chloroflexota bacterium]
MVCKNCKMELPVYAGYCPSCGMKVHKPHVHHEIDTTRGPRHEAHARHVDWLFEPVYREIERRLEEPTVDKSELFDTARRIEAEVLKGNEANPGKIVRWLKLYEEVAPDILGLTTTALLGPDVDVTPAVRDAILAFAPEPA